MRNGRLHINQTHDTFVDLRDSAPGGKIHPVDPAAVENFKRIIAEQAANGRSRRPQPQPKPRRQLDADLARKRDELLARSRANGTAASAQKKKNRR